MLFKNTWKLDFQNIVGLSFVVLAVALQTWALFKGLSCPYCFKQRVALVIVGVGFLIRDYSTDNRFEIARKTIMLGSSIWGAIIAFAQFSGIFSSRMENIITIAQKFNGYNLEQKKYASNFLINTLDITYWVTSMMPFWSMVMFFVLALYFVFSYAYKWDALVKFPKNIKFAYAMILAVILVGISSVEARQVTRSESEASNKKTAGEIKKRREADIKHYGKAYVERKAKEAIEQEAARNKIMAVEFAKLAAESKKRNEEMKDFWSKENRIKRATKEAEVIASKIISNSSKGALTPSIKAHLDAVTKAHVQVIKDTSSEADMRGRKAESIFKEIESGRYIPTREFNDRLFISCLFDVEKFKHNLTVDEIFTHLDRKTQLGEQLLFDFLFKNLEFVETQRYRR